MTIKQVQEEFYRIVKEIRPHEPPMADPDHKPLFDGEEEVIIVISHG